MKTRAISLESRGSLTAVVRVVVTQPGVRASNRVLVINQVSSLQHALASMRSGGTQSLSLSSLTGMLGRQPTPRAKKNEEAEVARSGIYGVTVEEIAARFIDKALAEKAEKGMLKLVKKETLPPIEFTKRF